MALLVSVWIRPAGEPGKLRGQIPASLLELAQRSLVPLLPSGSQSGQLALMTGLKFPSISCRFIRALAQIILEACLEPLMCQLLQQHRRQPDRDGRPNAKRADLFEKFDQWEVSLRGGFIKPCLAVGIAPVMQDIREVAMQHEAE